MNSIDTKEIRKYVDMPHKIEIKQDSGGFVVMIPDLPGCISQGDSLEEACEMIMEAKASWVESALLEKETIPEPSDEKKYSGKILLRIPPEQHMGLAEEARRQGVSLNQYLTYLLAKEHAKIEVHLHRTEQCENKYIIGRVEVKETSDAGVGEIPRY